METEQPLTSGLAALAPEQRREVYQKLRAGLGVSEKEPMLALPPAELAAWAARFAEILAAVLAKSPATACVANAALLQGALLEYAKTPDDAFLDSQLAMGAGLRAAGLEGIYLHALVNHAALVAGPRAAREVLSPALAAMVEERYPAVVLLRHSVMQEGAISPPRG